MYKLTKEGTIIKLDDNANPIMFIPPDPANSDYIEYQNWLSAGNTPIDENTPLECVDPTTWTVDQTCVLTKAIEEKKNEIKQKGSAYIYQYYPKDKQDFDKQDESYYENYLKARGIDELAFRDAIITSVLNIYGGTSDYATELTNLQTAFPVPVDANGNYLADPNVWNRAIDQLLKVAIRAEFVQRVKAEIDALITQAEAATDLTTLDSIVITYITPWPGV